MDRGLWGGHVQRLTLGQVGARELLLLQVRVPGQTVYVLLVSGRGVGLIKREDKERLRKSAHPPAGPKQALWRSRLEGAQITYIGENALELVHGGATLRAVGSQPLVLEGAKTPPCEGTAGPPLDSLHVHGRKLVEELVHSNVEGRRDTLRRALTKAMDRIARRVVAIGEDLAKMKSAAEDGMRAQLFVAEAARAPRGVTCLRATDWSTGTAQTVEWKIDPAKSAQEQLAATFRRAKRLKDGTAIALGRLGEAKVARDKLAELMAALEKPTTDLSIVESRARKSAPRDFKLTAGLPRTAPEAAWSKARPPYRKFAGASGNAILVGRNAAHNDALTTRVARPHDMWLHAKGWTGAHVVVPLTKGKSCPPDLLAEAAHLAAHFSDAREERVVEVTYTPRRYVRKPHGSSPGAVVAVREKVIVLQRNENILQKLLASEVEP